MYFPNLENNVKQEPVNTPTMAKIAKAFEV